MADLQGLLGLLALTGLAWLASERRGPPPWRIVAAGLALQLAVAAVFLKVPGASSVLEVLNAGFNALTEATLAGTAFVFGYLGGGPLPFDESEPGASFVLAFQALPVILVMSAVSALLFYWRILPAVIAGFSAVLRRAFRLSGAVGLAAAANIFVGMLEAPLLIRPYLKSMSRSDLFIVMAVGMSTIAGTVLALYAGMIGGVVEGAFGHLLVASVISAPAAVMIALLMVPRGSDASGAQGGPDATETAGDHPLPSSEARSAIDAVSRGATAGMGLCLNVAALLIVFVALITLVNMILALAPDIGGEVLTLQRIFGWVFAPVVFLIGIPWSEATTAGALMGTKTAINELVAYAEMAALPAEALSERSHLIMTYALSGFANFGSLAIMIGGLGTMAPERREEIVDLGLRSILAGTIATLMTGAVVGIVL